MSDQAVIEATELAKLLTHSGVVVLDCRYKLAKENLAEHDAGFRDYLEGHIPGARYASLHRDLSGPLQRYGGRHPMPSAQQFEQFARAVGIGADTRVVVYDDNRLAFAARAWWLLHYFGHEHTSVLNGGLAAWRSAGLPIAAGESPPNDSAGDFTCAPRSGLLLHHDEIYRQLDNPPWRLVDARDAERFAGITEPLDPIAGHIPTAVNKPWQGVTHADGRLKSAAELKAHWQDIPADERLLNYCGSGVTACVNLLSQHLIGRSDAQLYPGSWSDWCAHIVYPRTEKV